MVLKIKNSFSPKSYYACLHNAKLYQKKKTIEIIFYLHLQSLKIAEYHFFNYFMTEIRFYTLSLHGSSSILVWKTNIGSLSVSQA